MQNKYKASSEKAINQLIQKAKVSKNGNLARKDIRSAMDGLWIPLVHYKEFHENAKYKEAMDIDDVKTLVYLLAERLIQQEEK